MDLIEIEPVFKIVFKIKCIDFKTKKKKCRKSFSLISRNLS